MNFLQDKQDKELFKLMEKLKNTKRIPSGYQIDNEDHPIEQYLNLSSDQTSHRYNESSSLPLPQNTRQEDEYDSNSLLDIEDPEEHVENAVFSSLPFPRHLYKNHDPSNLLDNEQSVEPEDLAESSSLPFPPYLYKNHDPNNLLEPVENAGFSSLLSPFNTEEHDSKRYLNLPSDQTYHRNNESSSLSFQQNNRQEDEYDSNSLLDIEESEDPEDLAESSILLSLQNPHDSNNLLDIEYPEDLAESGILLSPQNPHDSNNLLDIEYPEDLAESSSSSFSQNFDECDQFTMDSNTHIGLL